MHHSAVGYRGSTTFLDLVEPLASASPELLRLTPQFEILVHDLSTKSDMDLRALALNAFGLLAALVLRDARAPERLIPGLARWRDLFLAISRAEDGGRALSIIIRYLLQVSELPYGSLSKALRTASVQEKTVMTIAEQLRKEGVDLGRRELLEQQLQHKFGKLDARAVEFLERADAAALARYAKAVLSAKSLDEVFAE